ncbi:DUF6660 family protein [Parafilimonas terrae]|uniref:DUF6660 family protein n=1 Tax=Parafilimonas terrae TaxID=1465490 RepID=UPI001160D1D2|nr:DUF6660 family protein [Parafilimonas terrae]
MKKWLCSILLLYILFSIIVPCSFFDKCEEKQQIQQAANNKQKNNCDNCSPFCVCSSAHNFTNNIIAAIEPAIFRKEIVYNDYYLSSSSEYHPSLFQPPRLG